MDNIIDFKSMVAKLQKIDPTSFEDMKKQIANKELQTNQQLQNLEAKISNLERELHAKTEQLLSWQNKRFDEMHEFVLKEQKKNNSNFAEIRKNRKRTEKEQPQISRK